jgi:hypothetical protein
VYRPDQERQHRDPSDERRNGRVLGRRAHSFFYPKQHRMRSAYGYLAGFASRMPLRSTSLGGKSESGFRMSLLTAVVVTAGLGFAPDGASASEASSSAEPETSVEPKRWHPSQAQRRAPPLHDRPWTLGLEAVVFETAPLRPGVVDLRRPKVGRSVTMAGVGAFLRYMPIRFIGIDVGLRSASGRYQGTQADELVSHDQLLVDGGVLLYLARGQVAQFGFSGGLGGSLSRVRYGFGGDPRGVQRFGSATFRVGAEAEFHYQRFAFIMSARGYGAYTDRDRVRADDALGEGGGRAPVATFAVSILGSAGIAVRF